MLWRAAHPRRWRVGLLVPPYGTVVREGNRPEKVPRSQTERGTPKNQWPRDNDGGSRERVRGRPRSVPSPAGEKNLAAVSPMCASILQPKNRQTESRVRRFRKRGRVERNQSGDYRAVPDGLESKGYGIA